MEKGETGWCDDGDAEGGRIALMLPKRQAKHAFVPVRGPLHRLMTHLP